MARRTKIHPLLVVRGFQYLLCRLRLVWLLTMVCISCTPVSISSIQAQILEESITFSGGISNNWRDAQNWGVAIPGEFSEVFIDSGSVLVTESGIAQQVFVGTGQPAQLNIQDGNFSVSKGLVVGEFGNLEINGGSSQIGSIAVNGLRDDLENTFSGLVNVSGGSLRTNKMKLGDIPGMRGELYVDCDPIVIDGDEVNVEITDHLILGGAKGSSGLLRVSGGAVSAVNVVSGIADSALGHIEVSGGTLKAGAMKLGLNGGSGFVKQTGGDVFFQEFALFDSSSALTVGDGEEAKGEYTLAGGELNLSGGEIHISSTGSFEHSGGHLTNVGSVLNEGVYTVTDGTFTAHHVTVGEIPERIEVINNTLVDNQDNAVGTLNLWGGTTNISGQLVLGGADAATGTLNVHAVTNPDGTFDDVELNITGATVVGRNHIGGFVGRSVSGVININGGNVTGTDLVLGQGAGAVGTIEVTNGVLQFNTLTVGAGGSGSVTQTGGDIFFQEFALFDSPSALTVGDGEEATGEYTLAGGALNLSGGEIHISSTGSFEHSGGHLTNVGSVLNEGVYNVEVSKNGEFAMSNVVEFTQTTAGTLSIQLAGPDGFRSGLATSSSNDPASTWGFGFIFAGGELRILPGENYTDPATRGTADDIVLIEAGTSESDNAYIVGAFDTVNYAGESLTIDFADEDGISFRSHVDNGLFRNVTYTATTVELQNLLAIEGDTDGDGDDDTYDLTQMIMNFTGATGNGKTWITGDIDDDGDTDTYDLTRAIINFTGARNSATAIPEPSGLLLLVLAIGCLASARGRSYRREI